MDYSIFFTVVSHAYINFMDSCKGLNDTKIIDRAAAAATLFERVMAQIQAELNDALKQIDSSVVKLVKDNTELRNEVGSLTFKLELETGKKSQQNQSMEMNQINWVDLNSKFISCSKDFNNLRRGYLWLETEKNNLNNTNILLNNRIRNINADNQTLQSEIRSLRQQIQILSPSKEIVSGGGDRIQIIPQQENCQELQKTINNQTIEINGLKTALNSEYALLEKYTTVPEKRTTGSLITSIRDLGDLKNSLNEEVTRLRDANHVLLDSTEKLKNELSEVKSEQSVLADQEKSNYDETIANQQTTIDALNLKLTEVGTERDQISLLLKEVRQSQSNDVIGQCNTFLRQNEKTIALLRTQIADYELGKTANLQKITTLTKEIKKFEQTIADFRTQYKNQKTDDEQKETKNLEQIEKLEKIIGECNEFIAKFKEKCQKQQTDITNLKKKIAELQPTTQEKLPDPTSFEQSEDVSRDLELKITNLENELETTKWQIDDLRKEQKLLNDKLFELKDVKTILTRTEAELEKVRSELNSCQSREMKFLKSVDEVDTDEYPNFTFGPVQQINQSEGFYLFRPGGTLSTGGKTVIPQAFAMNAGTKLDFNVIGEFVGTTIDLFHYIGRKWKEHYANDRLLLEDLENALNDTSKQPSMKLLKYFQLIQNISGDAVSKQNEFKERVKTMMEYVEEERMVMKVSPVTKNSKGKANKIIAYNEKERIAYTYNYIRVWKEVYSTLPYHADVKYAELAIYQLVHYQMAFYSAMMDNSALGRGQDPSDYVILSTDPYELLLKLNSAYVLNNYSKYRSITIWNQFIEKTQVGKQLMTIIGSYQGEISFFELLFLDDAFKREKHFFVKISDAKEVISENVAGFIALPRNKGDSTMEIYAYYNKELITNMQKNYARCRDVTTIMLDRTGFTNFCNNFQTENIFTKEVWKLDNFGFNFLRISDANRFLFKDFILDDYYFRTILMPGAIPPRGILITGYKETVIFLQTVKQLITPQIGVLEITDNFLVTHYCGYFATDANLLPLWVPGHLFKDKNGKRIDISEIETLFRGKIAQAFVQRTTNVLTGPVDFMELDTLIAHYESLQLKESDAKELKL